MIGLLLYSRSESPRAEMPRRAEPWRDLPRPIGAADPIVTPISACRHVDASLRSSPVMMNTLTAACGRASRRLYFLLLAEIDWVTGQSLAGRPQAFGVEEA